MKLQNKTLNDLQMLLQEHGAAMLNVFHTNESTEVYKWLENENYTLEEGQAYIYYYRENNGLVFLLYQSEGIDDDYYKISVYHSTFEEGITVEIASNVLAIIRENIQDYFNETEYLQ